MKCKLSMHVYVTVDGDGSIDVKVSSKYVSMKFFFKYGSFIRYKY